MPELPEVETIRRGLSPLLVGKHLQRVVVRERRLRRPVPSALSKRCASQQIEAIQRRAKYLLLKLTQDTLVIHLGMSGHLRLHADQNHPISKHDHVDFVFEDNSLLRYNDPRRFGMIQCVSNPDNFSPFGKLGPEPLSEDFNPEQLFNQCQRRRRSIKSCLMDQHIVVGVGNIYAQEALFLAKIHPLVTSNTLEHVDCETLVKTVKQVLQAAIQQGGTSLKDFKTHDGKPGYFQQTLQVYGRAGLPCYQCETPLEKVIVDQRSTVFCPLCQAL